MSLFPKPCTASFDHVSHEATFYDGNGDMLFVLKNATFGLTQVVQSRLTELQSKAYRDGVNAVRQALDAIEIDERLGR